MHQAAGIPHRSTIVRCRFLAFLTLIEHAPALVRVDLDLHVVLSLLATTAV